MKTLIGTSVTWFAIDVAFYGLNLNQSIILKAIGYGSSSDPFTALFRASLGNFIVALLGTVPGYWFTVYFIDTWGRRKI